MSVSLMLAAVMTVGVAITHSVLGEVKLIGPILSPEGRVGVLRHTFARRVMRFAWHVTSVAWIAAAAVFALLAGTPLTADGRVALLALGTGFLLTGVIVLASSRGRHLAWPIFLAIALAAIWPAL